MTLTSKQKLLIIDIDRKVKAILANGGTEETILVELLDTMPAIKQLIDLGLTREMKMCFQECDGFYRYMKILEITAQCIANGTIKVP